jgi:hypothetical protein
MKKEIIYKTPVEMTGAKPGQSCFRQNSPDAPLGTPTCFIVLQPFQSFLLSKLLKVDRRGRAPPSTWTKAQLDCHVQNECV